MKSGNELDHAGDRAASPIALWIRFTTRARAIVKRPDGFSDIATVSAARASARVRQMASVSLPGGCLSSEYSA